MKKFFEKHDLFKMAMIVLLLAVVFSWIMPYSYFNNGAFDTTQGITRIGFFDLSTYGLLGFYYFTAFFIFLFVVAGFYKLVGSIPAYQAMTNAIANVFKGKEKLLAVISIVLYAVLSSITVNYMSLLMLVPLSVTVFSKLKVDKVTGLASTIGGILVGVLCSTFGTQIAGYVVQVFSLEYVFELLPILIIAVVAIAALSFFVILRIDNPDKDDLLEDIFAPKATKLAKNTGYVGISIVLSIVLIIICLAFLPWEDAFKVTLFTDLMTNIKEAQLFGFPLFGALLGEAGVAFGSWDGFTVTGLLVLATLVLQLIYRIPADSVIDAYAGGFKKINKTVVLLLLVYAILVVSVVYPTVPYIVSGIAKLGSNVFTWFLSGVVTSVFGVDMQYVSTLTGSYLASVGNNSVAALAMQTSYGLVQFISPTSILLVFGLSVMDIKFKDYFKFIWKFLLGLLVVVLIVLAVIAYV